MDTSYTEVDQHSIEAGRTRMQEMITSGEWWVIFVISQSAITLSQTMQAEYPPNPQDRVDLISFFQTPVGFVGFFHRAELPRDRLAALMAAVGGTVNSASCRDLLDRTNMIVPIADGWVQDAEAMRHLDALRQWVFPGNS